MGMGEVVIRMVVAIVRVMGVVHYGDRMMAVVMIY